MSLNNSLISDISSNQNQENDNPNKRKEPVKKQLPKETTKIPDKKKV